MIQNNVLLSFQIPLRVLRALNRFASTDESRYVINSIRVDATPAQILLVATNGRALGTYNAGSKFEYTAEVPPSFIIPRTLVERAVKVWPDETVLQEDEMGREYNAEVRAPEVMVEYHNDKSVTIAGPDCNLTALAIDGIYPDWRKVLPTTDRADVPPNLNPLFLRVFVDAADDLADHRGPTLCLRGYASEDPKDVVRTPFTVHMPRVPFLGIIMPMRMEETAAELVTIPTWVK